MSASTTPLPPSTLLGWSLLFARQPEPDLEFTEEELEQTMPLRSTSPLKAPPPKPKKRPLFWILVAVLLGGGVYVATEPEMVMDLIGPLVNDTPEPPPPLARKPASAPSQVPSPPSPSTAQPSNPVIPPADDRPAETAGPPSQLSSAESSTPVAPAPAAQSATATPPSAPQTTPAPPNHVPPLFEEGQRVALLPNPEAPKEKVALLRDAAGTSRGPAVPPGTVFTILDGELQDEGWVYYVRSDYGTTGWLRENQLRPKR
ncbi:MAG: hypothetical protein NNA18_05945 [Nitrospira sp.]|nr:hypothetical protein [Nitrospira sp.]